MEKNIAKRKMPTGNDEVSSNETTEIWTIHEKEFSKSRYGCEIIQENCSPQDAKNPQLPNDAYLVSYIRAGRVCFDITRSGKRVNIFDMYYDKFGNTIQSIEWADGRVNPKLWGYKAPEKKKRK